MAIRGHNARRVLSDGFAAYQGPIGSKPGKSNDLAFQSPLWRSNDMLSCCRTMKAIRPGASGSHSRIRLNAKSFHSVEAFLKPSTDGRESTVLRPFSTKVEMMPSSVLSGYDCILFWAIGKDLPISKGCSCLLSVRRWFPEK